MLVMPHSIQYYLCTHNIGSCISIPFDTMQVIKKKKKLKNIDASLMSASILKMEQVGRARVARSLPVAAGCACACAGCVVQCSG